MDKKAKNRNKKNGIIINFIWRLLERFGANIVTFVISIVLARLLDPETYGIVALITAITTILQVFVDSGLANALIQKKDADNKDFSTVFFFNITVCACLYLILFFLAPFIANFFGNYDSSLLTWLIRVSSLTLIISGVKNVQQAYVAKNMIFKKFFFATLGGTIGAAFIGVFLAIKGFGAWALVGQLVFNATIDTIVLWFTVKWRPIKYFSFKRLRVLLSFGWKLLLTNLLRVGYAEIRSLIIGKKYSADDLAFHQKGNLFPKTIVNNVDSAMDSVLLPSMSMVQNDKNHLKELTRMSIKLSTFIMFPLMAGLAMCSESIIIVFLTSKWLPASFFMVIFSAALSLHPIHTANLNAIMASGRSDLVLKLEVVKKIIDFIILIVSMWFGVKAIAIGFLACTVLEQIVNAFPNRKLIDYGILQQFYDLIPNIIPCFIMCVFVYFVGYGAPAGLTTLVKQVVVGGSVYFLFSCILKNKSLTFILNKLKGL